MNNLIKKIRYLSDVGISLSTETDSNQLLQTILNAAIELTNSDGGTIYNVTEDEMLAFNCVINKPLNIFLESPPDSLMGFSNIPLNIDNKFNDLNIAAYAANHNKILHIDNVYSNTDFDFTGPKKFDEKMGYETRSVLTMPLTNHERNVIGVLQLVNSRIPETNSLQPYSELSQQLAHSLASQAAIAMTNTRLIEQLHNLFESFSQLIAEAIDQKSPYTAKHCRQLPSIAMMLAEALHSNKDGPLADFELDDKDRYELNIAAWLHDCGKIVTPNHIMDKATKLETIFDRIELIETRFEAYKAQLEVKHLRMLAHVKTMDSARKLIEKFNQEIEQANKDSVFLRHINIGSEYLSPEDEANIERIAQYQWKSPQGTKPLLTENECYNLKINRGTLTREERQIVNDHMIATIKMLEALPFPDHLKNVPEYACGHHERMDGKGYPRGLTRDQMSIPARLMGIADIFEALSDADRPYKKGKKLSECLTILGKMRLDNHIDPDIFDVFIREKVYMQYAKEYMNPDQIDEVDIDNLAGYNV